MKTEVFLSPVPWKSGWSSLKTKSVGWIAFGCATDEIKARRTSEELGPGVRSIAGRTFFEVRSVKGKETRTMPPRWRVCFEKFKVFLHLQQSICPLPFL